MPWTCSTTFGHTERIAFQGQCQDGLGIGHEDCSPKGSSCRSAGSLIRSG